MNMNIALVYLQENSPGDFDMNLMAKTRATEIKKGESELLLTFINFL